MKSWNRTIRATLGALLGSALIACSVPTHQTQASEAATATTSQATRAQVSRCASNDPRRQAFFGDVHIHSAWSMDAYTGDVRATPEDSYRFARGERIALAGGRSAQLERPLDFAAVSDHAEYLGEVSLCTTPGSPRYDTERCAYYRGETTGDGISSRMGVLLDDSPPYVELAPFGKLGTPIRSPEMCGEDFSLCREASANTWKAARAITEAMNDTSSACRFTSLHAYEYTWTPLLSKIHRNVIFRNATVPSLPVTSVEARTPRALWDALERECLDAGTGCDVLAIPHNSNLSNGRMFKLDYLEAPGAEHARLAAQRARVEPLVEIFQVKGDSECRNGFSRVVGGRDELCDFEKFRAEDTEECGDDTGIGALAGAGCISRLDFVRYALTEGLREQQRIGVNPLKLGISAATDTHNATPGDTEEYSYDGAHGSRESTTQARLTTGPGAIVPPTLANPGGLFGVWAEENSRDSLFDAMQRRETFGTSGVRIRPRFFGGWELSKDACGATDIALAAYEDGVPMGSDLPPAPSGAESPSFLATALADPGTAEHPGGRLERIQVIKGWVGDDGELHQAVYPVASADAVGGEPDPATCAPPEGGADSLCGVFRDPDFDPSRPAVYYSRVVERPSCRWTTRHCLALPADERPASCSDPEVTRSIRERAWTSPIWYTPSAG